MKCRILLLIFLSILCAVPVHAARMYAVCRMVGGVPDFGVLTFRGYVLLGTVGQYGAYLISGTPAELVAINALPVSQVVGICGRTDSGGTIWNEGDEAFPEGIRTIVNNFLTARSLPTIGTGLTKKQAAILIFQRFIPDFDWQANWVRGPEDD